MTRTQERLVQFATRLLRLALRSLRVTMRYADGTTRGASAHPFASEIYAIRERDLVTLSCMTRFTPFTTLIAQGKDGDWATVVGQGLGCHAVRGSSRHDPAASALSFVRALRNASTPAFLVVDGPLGPSGVAKEGIGAIARLTGRPVIPIVAEASVGMTLRQSWSQMVIPCPFARITISVGAPITVRANADRESIDRVADLVTAAFRESLHPVSDRSHAAEGVAAPR